MRITLELGYEEAVAVRNSLSRNLDAILDRGLPLDLIKALEAGIAEEDRHAEDSVSQVFRGIPKPAGRICICWNSGATTPMIVCNDSNHWLHDREFSG